MIIAILVISSLSLICSSLALYCLWKLPGKETIHHVAAPPVIVQVPTPVPSPIVPIMDRKPSPDSHISNGHSYFG